MDRPWKKVSGPGTVDDLLDDAAAAGFSIQKRTIDDWIARGLLDRPQRKGAGRGSRPGVHTATQRKLFLLLLTKREETPKLPALALIPLSTWLWLEDEEVPTRQALKAFRTWLGDAARRKEVCHDAAVRSLAQIDHPAASDTARNRFVRLYEQAVYRRGAAGGDLEELEAAAHEVFEPPSVFGSSVIRRAVGSPAMPITVEHVIYEVEAMSEAIRAVRCGHVSEQFLSRSRDLYRHTKSEFEARRPMLASGAAGAFVEFFGERTVQDHFDAVGTELLAAVGVLLTSPRAQARFPERTT